MDQNRYISDKKYPVKFCKTNSRKLRINRCCTKWKQQTLHRIASSKLQHTLFLFPLVMQIFLTFILICSSVELALSRVIQWRRLKRNVFDPSLPAFPNANSPFYQPPPYPLPATTMAPASALMPQPPKYHDYSADNPYLDAMNDPINPNYGLGLSAMQPTILGGSFNFPTGNLLRPQENVGGTFGFSRPVQVRFGTQGGPFYPWQDKQYAKTINSIEDANVRREALRRDAESYYDRRASEQSITPYRDQPPLPPKLPPSFRMFDLPPLPSASGR